MTKVPTGNELTDIESSETPSHNTRREHPQLQEKKTVVNKRTIPRTRAPCPEPTSIRWQPPLYQVPSLVDIILDKMSKDISLISTDAIDVMDDLTATALLHRIMQRRLLNTVIAQRFIASRHDRLADALSRLDLLAGIGPPTKQY
mmetsp:Transcript_5099/g.7188  ORF Transcript_5099/g.7188 Transcript_5099/m.7188 type:complete len:145 (-) Transcript_5099:31-465(-)